MYGWLAAPFVLVAGSSPAGHAPAKAASSRTVSEPPFFGVPCEPVVELEVDDLFVLLLPHATSANAAAATHSATSGMTRCLCARTVTPLLRRPGPSHSARRPGAPARRVSRPPLPCPRVDGHREQQDHAEGDLLVEGIEAKQVVPVADERDEQDAEEGAPDRALAAQDARAADDDAGQHGEGERVAGGRLRAEHARGVDDAGQAGGAAADREGQHADRVDA